MNPMPSTPMDEWIAEQHAVVRELRRDGHDVEIPTACGHPEYFPADFPLEKLRTVTGELCVTCTLLVARELLCA